MANPGFPWLGGRLDVPMFIVTTTDGRERSGCLVGFSSQCSIHPIRFMVFISKKNHTFGVLGQARWVAVHVVPDDRWDLAELFGHETGDEVDKFERCDWRPGPGGVPILEGPSDWFVGEIVSTIDTGDHMGFVLEPRDGDSDDPHPLGFQQAQEIEPGHEA